ncbi:MAG TPA: hypothetical protein ENG86_11050 [Nitrospirae bacterium]|nr:hypothetical protein [Nitrospirota bacterium]
MKENDGSALIEVMVALVVLLIVLMGLYQAAALSIDSNMRNLLRDEAVRIASDEMNTYRSAPFDGLAVGIIPQQTINRNIRNVAALPFYVNTTISALDANSKQINMTVMWGWKDRTIAGGNPYTFNTMTVVKR